MSDKENPDFSLEDFLEDDFGTESTEAKPTDWDSALNEMLENRTTDDVVSDEILPDNDDDVIARIEKSEEELARIEAEEVQKEMDAVNEAINAERTIVNDIARQIQELRMKQYEHQQKIEVKQEELRPLSEKKREIGYKMRRAQIEAERLEAARKHREEEEKRERDILSRKNVAMAGFKTTINEINPAWKDYAFDHQWEGASSLALHEGGLLADDMGLGKSLTAIMFADMVKAKNILVVTPANTATNFTLEWGMWAQHRFVWTLAGNNKSARHSFVDTILQPRVDAGGDITLVINYEMLYSDNEFLAKLHALNFDLIIVDEFHNAKDRKSLLFNKLLTFRHAGCKRFLPVTGTFILNSPKDIWTGLHLVDPEAFPTEKRFLDSYCEFDYYNNRWKFRSGGEKSMLIALGGRIVKRTMEEAGIVLPKQNIIDVPLNWSDEYAMQQKILKQLAQHSQIILDANTKMSVIAQIALITRQRQGVTWPGGIELKDPETQAVVFSVKDFVSNSIKVDYVFDKAMELLAQGKRITVFSQFKTGLAELERKFKEANVKAVRYDGDTDNATKSRVKRDFDRRHVEKNNGEYEWDIALCNYKVGGVGLNFTHATEMIMLDEEWNPGKNEQAYKRQRRIGQTEETNVWIPLVNDSIDAWMRELNDQKRKIIAGFDAEVDLSKELNSFLAIYNDNE